MDKSSARILYIEDYPIIQTMYVDVLRSRGFVVDVVSDGKAALEKVAGQSYDVILLDLLLPHVSGTEFLREFRTQNYTGEVVILSDFDDPKTMKVISKLGIKYFWTKVENTPHLLAERLEHLVKGIPDAVDSK